MPFDPEQIHAVVFDMDGVLLDSETLYRKFAFQTARELGFTIPEKLHLATIGLTGAAGEELIRAELGEHFPYEEFDHVWRGRVAAAMMEHVPLKPGVHELLGTLQGLDIPAAIATSSNHGAAHHHLSRADIIAHFDVLVTGDDVDNSKPHPEPFLLAAERLEVEPENCLALEDSYNGIRAAFAAGMQAVMVPDLLPPTDEMKRIASAIVPDLHAIRNRFEAG